MFKVDVNGFTQQYRSKPIMNVDITKPLTYDYMPEGYPKKVIETVTLMEEQEVTFSNLGGVFTASSPVQFYISDGQTYTIVWDGVEYSCVCHAMEDGFYIGNPAAFGLESTGEPFVYVIEPRCLWVSYDTAKSHTIGVTGPDMVYKTIDKKFLPEVEKFVVDATNLPSDVTGWGNLSDSLRAALDVGAEIFLDVHGGGETLLKLTGAQGSKYLFIYPKNNRTVSAYILEAFKSDGGKLKNYDIYTHVEP